VDAILSVIAVVLISMLINRFAAVALSLTGMSREEARFQARAAMSGVGLTTRTPEDIVGHPVRRRIVLWLMIVGSAGIVTAVASLVLSFRGASAGDRLTRAVVLVAALFLVWLISRTGAVDRALSRAMAWVLGKRGFVARDYGTLLDLSGDYAVAELQVREGDWVADRSLRDLRLRDEGVVVMGIHRADGYLGAPGPETIVEVGDTLVLYGREARIAELDRRASGARGDAAHAQAAAEEDSVEDHPRPVDATRHA
jgi:K+/H+ antiporter YhaU regulatory subunit KhtT